VTPKPIAANFASDKGSAGKLLNVPVLSQFSKERSRLSITLRVVLGLGQVRFEF